MSRLPTPGGDDGTWGAVLNDFLLQAHTTGGNLKPGTVTNTILADGAVSAAKVDNSVLQTSDCVVVYSGTQPLRNTVTTDSLRRVRWVSASAPIIGNGYAINGLDVWERTA